MKHLSHSGLMVTYYEPVGFSIKFKGKEIKLAPEQEEMAVAWAKKLGTSYVEAKIFIKNFLNDF